MTGQDVARCLEVARDVATLVIAGVATYYAAVTALATRQAGKDTVFIGSTVTSLLDVVTRARSVRAAYRAMFSKFTTAQEKAVARGRWLQQREEAGALLRELAEMLPEIAPAIEFWKIIEKEEDTFVTGDSLVLPKPSAIEAAYDRYDAEHAKFIKSVGVILRKLR